MKYKGWVSTGIVGSEEKFEFEVIDEEVEGMSEEHRIAYIEDIASDMMHERIEWGYEAVPPSAEMPELSFAANETPVVDPRRERDAYI